MDEAHEDEAHEDEDDMIQVVVAVAVASSVDYCCCRNSL